MRNSRSFLATVLRLLATLAGVGAVTWLDVQAHVNSSTAAFSFLLLVLGLAAWSGLRESIAASLAGMLAYNYFFLPPIGSLTIADPQNWAALVVFLITAITASQLSSSARRKAEEAADREQELRRMYDFSRALMLGDPDRTLAVQATEQITELFGAQDVRFYDASTRTTSGSRNSNSPVSDDTLRQVAATGTIWRNPAEMAMAVPIGLGGTRLGSLAVSGQNGPSDVALQAIAQLMAIAIERGRAQEIANRAEVAKHNEQLKSTLLDALAHEFKTPLTSVKLATSALLVRTNLDETERELLSVLDEEADRLTNLVSDSIELARLGTGRVELHREIGMVEPLITSAMVQLRALFDGREIDLKIEPSLPFVEVDRKLVELVLRQLLSNAIKYSPPDTPIQLRVERNERCIVIGIKNAGPGIPEDEQSLLFEKFYRSPQTKGGVSGTGMGLAIARDIIQSHGGRIWVESAPNEGAQFSFTLPIAQTVDTSEPQEKTTVA